MTERGADGKFTATGMNKMMLQALYNKPSRRLMRILIDNDAAIRNAKIREQEEADNE
jgi:hypothetical protein